MSGPNASAMLRHLYRLAVPASADLSDAELLERFVGRGEGAAFAALVRRHGPMVLGVCRRRLGDTPDAEDAFQATFLVLARRAASIRRRAALASWLYGVARRVAAKAGGRATRQKASEEISVAIAPGSVLEDVTWRELRAALDEELERLPDRYRAPLVLCYLDGRTQDEAAQRLGWSPRTLRRRLERGRGLLRARLEGRGLTLSAGLCVVLLADRSASAAVSSALASATVAAVLSPGSSVGTSLTVAASLARDVLAERAPPRLAVAVALLLSTSLLAAGAYLGIRPAAAAPPSGDQASAEDGPPQQPAAERVSRTDVFGDPLPPGALARMGTIRLRHAGHVSTVAFLPDGKTCVSGGYDGRILVWEVATGRRLREIAAARAVDTVVLSPDGRTLASAGYDSAVRLWDLGTGKILHTWPKPGTTSSTVAFAPDGATIAWGGEDRTIHLGDVATGKEKRAWQAHDGFVLRLAFSPDGKKLASLCQDDGIRLWDPATGQEMGRMNTPRGSLSALAFAPDGLTLLSGSSGLQPIRVWDVATGQQVREFGKTDEATWAMVVSRDGKSVFAAGTDGLCRQWDVGSGRELRRFPMAGETANGLALSPDGKRLLAGTHEHNLHLWDVESGREVMASAGPTEIVTAVRFTSDGKHLVTGGTDRSLRLWDAASGRELRRFAGVEERLFDVALSPERRILAAGGSKPSRLVVRPPELSPIRLWDMDTGKALRSLPGHKESVQRLAFSPDGRTLASRGGDATLLLWDLTTGSERRGLEGIFAKSYGDVVFSSDGKWVATRRDGETVCVWDTATGKRVRELKLPEWRDCRLIFTPDDKTLIVGGSTQPVRLWEMATGNERGRLEGPPVHVSVAALSPDGYTLVTGNYADPTRFWDLATGRKLCEFDCGVSVCSLEFRPDGLRLASGHSDGTALVWDVEGTIARRRPAKTTLAAAQLDALWADLRGDDAGKAYRAVWALALAPESSVPFLRTCVRPASGSDAGRLARLVADLDNDAFETREKAAEEIRKLGELAEPSLRQALKGTPSPELRRRAETLLADLGATFPTGDRLRLGRALEALERAGTAEARALLEELARGAPEASLTGEALAAAARVARLARP